MTTTERRTAYLFEDVGGWYICSDESGYLDTRGAAYPTRAAAVRRLRERVEAGQSEYTHYRTGKMPKPQKI